MTEAVESSEDTDNTEDSTRRRIIGAALDCILERGFYRASSNEIARRAGTTWGAIQYYFGTRERLMLAALDECNAELSGILESTVIKGDSAAERLEQLAAVLAQYYGRPRYLAALQIVMNLAHNPDTSQETAAALRAVDRRASARLRETIRAAVGGGRADAATISLVFHALRGLAVSHVIENETRPRELASPLRSPDQSRNARELARALGGLFDGRRRE